MTSRKQPSPEHRHTAWEESPMAEPQVWDQEARGSWFDDFPITDAQIEVLRLDLESPLSRHGGGFAPFVVRKLLNEVVRRGVEIGSLRLLIADEHGRLSQDIDMAQYRITHAGMEDLSNTAQITHATCDKVILEADTDAAELLRVIADHCCPGPWQAVDG